ncbi:MAG: AMP-binding protein [Candidatus Aenigmarchaeota archaeon]|nr:AMP-binding protein [Candidatus Aenigmarchaeota archaeon]
MVNTFGDFANLFRHYSNRTAIKIRPRFRTISWTYGELLKNSLAIAKLLVKNKVKKGDKVILWAPNSHLWVASFFGIQFVGAVAVPISIQNDEKFVRKIIKQTNAKVVMKTSRFSSIRKMKNIDLENISFDDYRFTPVKTRDDNIAEIVYTSGTTGDPKGVVLMHRNILSNVKAISEIITIKPDDRFLSILPLSHMFEQTAGMLLPFYKGCQITYATSLNSIALRKNLVDDRITKLVAVPEFLKIVMNRIENEAENQNKKKQLDRLFNISEKIPFMSLRKIIFRPVLKKFGNLDTVASGGAPLEKEIGEKWEKMGIYVLQGYGTTETSPVISANGYEDRKIDSVGKVVDGVEIKFSDDGEILVNGPNVTLGYYKRPDKTEESFLDGWYRTGDAGYRDDDGYLYIKGRTKYMIILESGENVYPEDIENELNKSNVESCVVGLNRNGNVEIHAVLSGKIKNPEKIIEDANSKLASYQQIQGYTIWPYDDFPRTVTRKIKKEEVISYLQSAETKTENKNNEHSYVERIISQIVGINSGRINDKSKLVSDLKMDSLQRVELVSRIEDETGVIIDESDIGIKTTVRDIKKKIENKKHKIEKYEFNEWPLSNTIINLRNIVNNLIIFPLISLSAPQKIEGLENLEGLKAPVMFMSNHISGMDAGILSRALPKKFRRVAVAAGIDSTHEKFPQFIPLLNFIFNIYPFARKGQIKSSIDYTGRLVDRRFSIMLFPEGRVSKDAKLKKIKDGAGFLAVEMDIPIVPVKLIGANYVYPLGRRIPELPTRHDVKIKFGKPIYFSPDTSYIDATRTIEKAMKEL